MDRRLSDVKRIVIIGHFEIVMIVHAIHMLQSYVRVVYLVLNRHYSWSICNRNNFQQWPISLVVIQHIVEAKWHSKIMIGHYTATISHYQHDGCIFGLHAGRASSSLKQPSWYIKNLDRITYLHLILLVIGALTNDFGQHEQNSQWIDDTITLDAYFLRKPVSTNTTNKLGQSYNLVRPALISLIKWRHFLQYHVSSSSDHHTGIWVTTIGVFDVLPEQFWTLSFQVSYLLSKLIQVKEER